MGGCAAPGQGFGDPDNSSAPLDNGYALPGSPFVPDKASDKGTSALTRLHVSLYEQRGGRAFVGGSASASPLTGGQNVCRERSWHDVTTLDDSMPPYSRVSVADGSVPCRPLPWRA